MNNKIVLFDGVCNLCSNSVQFILKRDHQHQFLFGSLQGVAGQQYLDQFHLAKTTFNSFMLVEEGVLYTKSTAALRILKHLGGGWALLYALIVIPTFLRDGIYNVVAKNRYQWFGKKEACWLPTADLKARFLE